MFYKLFIIIAVLHQVRPQIDHGFDPRCPEVDPPIGAVHLPHESLCEYFYKCANTHRWLFPCPPGLHWSVDHDACEWPHLANCRPELLPPLPTTLVPPSTTTSSIPTVGVTTTTTSPPIIDDCPVVDNPNNIVFLPNRNRCDAYYLCFNGNKIPRTCYNGLHWDQGNLWCDHPANVNCSNRQ